MRMMSDLEVKKDVFPCKGSPFCCQLANAREAVCSVTVTEPCAGWGMRRSPSVVVGVPPSAAFARRVVETADAFDVRDGHGSIRWQT
jgi:hypothetical protein